MNRRELRTFIKTGVNLMEPTIEFGSGLIDDFNSSRSHTYPSVWMNIKSVRGVNPVAGAPIDDWEIELIVAQKDALDSNPEDYEDIIDNCDEIAQKLMYNYNKIVSGYKLVTLSNRTRDPFVKKYADCLTGVTLSFTMNVPDQTNLC